MTTAVPVGALAYLSTLAGAARSATEERNAQIRKLRADGASLRDIARAAGLSHGAIARIVNKT